MGECHCEDQSDSYRSSCVYDCVRCDFRRYQFHFQRTCYMTHKWNFRSLTQNQRKITLITFVAIKTCHSLLTLFPLSHAPIASRKINY